MEEKKLVIIITGGAGKLGSYLAKSFLQKGQIVNIIDIVKNETLVNEHLDYYCADISNYEEVQRVFEKIYAKYKRIDILINNAAKRYFADLADAPIEDITSSIKINLEANYFTTKEALKYMKLNGFGRIINISSHSSVKGYARGSIYCATKAALNTFTEAISKEIDENLNLTVNALCPSGIYTQDTKEGQVIGDKLISPETVFRIVYKLIYGNLNGAVIPIVPFGILLFGIFYQIKKAFAWIRYFIWRHL